MKTDTKHYDRDRGTQKQRNKRYQSKKETQQTQHIQQEPTQIHYKTINVHFV